MSDKNFGVLTLATMQDYQKAIGLALSLRVSNPGVKVAVVCSSGVGKVLGSYFDYVIEEIKGLKGFRHKVHLDRYSPFQRTFFFDSDVLVFKDLSPFIHRCGDRPYSACGRYMTDGKSSFGLDRRVIIEKMGFAELAVIDGAGHAFFDTDKAASLFDRARYITQNYDSFAPGARYADEDVMNIVLTEFGVSPVIDDGRFFSRLLSAKRGTLSMDARYGICSFVEASDGLPRSPCMMHFAADEGFVRYTLELFRLFKHYGVPTKGLLASALGDMMRREIRPRIKNLIVKNKSVCDEK